MSCTKRAVFNAVFAYFLPLTDVVVRKIFQKKNKTIVPGSFRGSPNNGARTLFLLLKLPFAKESNEKIDIFLIETAKMRRNHYALLRKRVSTAVYDLFFVPLTKYIALNVFRSGGVFVINVMFENFLSFSIGRH